MRAPERLVVALGMSLLVACSGSDSGQGTGPQSGSVAITTATAGGDPDPDGYALSLNGTAAGTIGSNASRTLSDLPTGAVTVGLSGISPNCVLAGANPRTVTVTASVATPAAFMIACTSLTGSLTISSATTGSDLDLDGYGYSIDNGAIQSLAINASVDVSGLSPGSHSVTLSDVAPNCAAAGGLSKNVTVVAGGTVTASFSLTCSANVGTLVVQATTTGRNLDPDGFLLQFGGSAVVLPVNGAVTLPNVPAGLIAIALSGATANCAFLSPATTIVAVAYGDTTFLPVQARCLGSLQGRLVFQGNCQVEYGGKTSHCGLMSMEQDGSGREMITFFDPLTAFPPDDPDVSPDGLTILYTTWDPTHNRVLYRVDRYGNNTQLIALPYPGSAPAWSPNGSKIAFTCDYSSVCIMNADGTGIVQLSPPGSDISDPVWSPDGMQVAAVSRSAADGFGSITVMAANGATDTTFAAPVTVSRLAWSPDGSTIAFASGTDEGSVLSDIYAIAPDGSGFVQLTTSGSDSEPTWSPSGGRIAFLRSSADPQAYYQVYTMAPNGSSIVRVSGATDIDAWPTYGPP